MKMWIRTVSVLVLAGLLVLPTTMLADELLIPVKKVITPGVTTVEYGAQTLTVSTTVPLKMHMSLEAPDGVVVRFIATNPIPFGKTASLQIYWEEWGEYIFDGDPPATWEEILLTEGGWIDR